MAATPQAALTLALPPGVQVLERGWLSSNSVVFDDGDTISVVDSGYVLHADQTAALIAQVAGSRRLGRLICTHLHSDHVGANALLQRRFGPQTLVPPGEAAAVAAWDEQALSYAATAQDCPRFGFDALLEPGGRIDAGGLAWDVLAAPGHDAHMVMLHNAVHGILISADALWENGFGVIFPELDGQSGFAEQAQALDAIAAIEPRIVIPGHGAPFADIAGALARARARLAALAASPVRNARHGLRVLVKFWLLQVREAERGDLHRHFAAARYPREICRRHFDGERVGIALDRAVTELCAAGAARRTGDRIANLDREPRSVESPLAT